MKHLLSLFTLIYISHVSCNEAQKGRERIFKHQLGEYVIDLNKTNLGIYSKDSSRIKNLKIVFYSDSTFRMNMKVPFLYDSTGTWVAGNLNEWNYLKFGSFNYNGTYRTVGTPFTRLHKDSTWFFLMSSATPQDENEVVSTIFFKKIK